MTEFELPIKLESMANSRMHWRARSRLAKEQRQLAAMSTPAGLKPPLQIVITRRGPRALDDDNLAGSAKFIRDGIADKIGIDDGSSLLVWQYRQERRADCSVRVQIMRRRRPRAVATQVVLDELMEGPGTIAELETRIGYLKRAAIALALEALVPEGLAYSVDGRSKASGLPAQVWHIKRTEKSQ